MRPEDSLIQKEARKSWHPYGEREPEMTNGNTLVSSIPWAIES
jgi:hypothetical protein